MAGVAEPDPTPQPPDGQPDPGQGLDRHRVRLDECPDVTDHQLRVTSLYKRPGTPAERRDVLGLDRANQDQDGRIPVRCHPSTRPDGPGKLSAGTDEFGLAERSPWARSGTEEEGGIAMKDMVAVGFVSVDGVAEAPEKWTTPYFDDQMGQAMQSSMDASDAMLLGRRTYEDFVAYWPDKTAEDDPYADYINATQKFVVSRTLKSVEWRNSTLITGDVVEELTKLKQQPGKNLTIVGSPTLMRYV
jgi:dihydrofolate reductase